MSTEKVFSENPPEVRWILVYFVVFLVFMALGLRLFFSKEQSMIGLGGLIFFASFGVFFMILAFYREYVHRPVQVEVETTEVLLHFRIGPSRRYSWSDIAWVSCRKKRRDDRGIGFGMIKFHKGLPFPLTYEIASEIRQRYRSAYGRYPPSRNGNGGQRSVQDETPE